MRVRPYMTSDCKGGSAKSGFTPNYPTSYMDEPYLRVRVLYVLRKVKFFLKSMISQNSEGSVF